MTIASESELTLSVISLRYSSWSTRALLTLLHADADLRVDTVTLPLKRQGEPVAPGDTDAYVQAQTRELESRRKLGSVTGLFPVLHVGGAAIHEALAICEWTAERYPEAGLWPTQGLARAQARSLSAEMAGGFGNLRAHMSCHVTARVPGFVPDGPTRMEIMRVFELLERCLDASGGPLLYGSFGIVDAMYFPVLTRFDTYQVPLPEAVARYRDDVWDQHAVKAWRQHALSSPSLPAYDAYIRELGGDPEANAGLQATD